jgi:non-specific serine/threonine protein kinase/serine/threonine-protein kinase
MPDKPQDGVAPVDANTTKPQPESRDAIRTVGPYRLLQLVGQGGMGEVWLAEQTHPVRRQVALKVIKAGMDTAQVVTRFEAERQALALMDHPAIATVYDGGSTPEGRPYFAMEYVKGEPITSYCDRQRLTTQARLGLFVQVCEGVQHAHQKGIIHRDLKPSNVLVTIQDDHPVPKIIDFGVAKATAHHLTARTLYTELGVMIGTPEYMSPEQAEMSGMDVDTRTDIYALGVILYELLTGALPFDGHELRRAGLAEIQRIIREKEPPKPSTRVTQLGPASTDTAARRHTEPRRLAGELRGDLDWVTMKALEKDRTRRYETATALAGDIQRHRNHEPVSAGPPSAIYRAGKFVRRHRFGVAAAATLVLLLVAFGATMAVQAQRIARERDRANREAARANVEAAAATQVSNFLVGLFKVSDPGEARGNSVTAREILDKGAAQVQKDLAGQPVVQARIMSTMGAVYQSLGLYNESAALFRKSVDVRRRALGNRDPAVAASLSDLGPTLVRAGDLPGAEAALNEALALQESLCGKACAEVAVTVRNLAEIAYVRGDYARAETLFRRGLETLRGLPPGNDEAIADCLNDLAMTVQQTRADYKGAQELLGESLAILRRLFGSMHPKVANGLNNLAKVSYRLGDYATAETLFLESLSMNRTLHGEEHPEISANLSNLALVARDRRDYAKANALFEQAVPMDRRLFGPSHLIVAGDLNYWAESLRRSGDARRAESIVREALAIQMKALPPGNWQVASTNTLLARCLAQEGRFVVAERLFLDAYPIIEKQFPPGHPRLTAAAQQGAEIYETWGKPDKAAEWRAKLPAPAAPAPVK